MTTRWLGVMAECEARTQGAPIAALLALPRTTHRAGQRGQTARASFRCEFLAHRSLTPLGKPAGVAEDPYRWDERVEAWEEVATSDAFRAIRDRIVEVASPTVEDVVVDLGAGTGLLTLALAPQVHEIVAVDISERMLE